MRDVKCRCWFTAIDSVCLSELVQPLANVQLMSGSSGSVSFFPLGVTLNLRMSLRIDKPRKMCSCSVNEELRWSLRALPGRSEPSRERWTAAAQSDSPAYTWVQPQHRATSHWWVFAHRNSKMRYKNKPVKWLPGRPLTWNEVRNKSLTSCFFVLFFKSWQSLWEFVKARKWSHGFLCVAVSCLILIGWRVLIYNMP